MNLIDQILNLAALLLWLSWRSASLMPHAESTVLTLASALRKAEPHRTSRAYQLITLIGILGARSVVYWHLGKGINWTPAFDLVVITLPFRSDRFLLMLIFSGVSFGLVLGLFYSWLLFVSAVNQKVSDSEPLQKLVRIHLGWIERCPAWIKLLLPLGSATLLWAVMSPGFVRLGIIPSAVSRAHLWQQAVVLGLASLLVWKILVLGIFLIHLLNSYVYLGNRAVLNYVSLTARNLLRALSWLPLRIGRLDFSPLAGVALVLLASKFGTHWLPKLYQQLPLS